MLNEADHEKLECENCGRACERLYEVSFLGDVCRQCRDEADEAPEVDVREDFHSDG